MNLTPQQVHTIRERGITLLTLLGDFRPESARLTRLDHSLQMATRAKNAGQPAEVIIACLMHDIGHIIPGCNHAQVAADFLKPFISTETYSVLRFHTLLGQGDPVPRALQTCAWCDDFIRWDIVSWEIDYPTLSLSHFMKDLDTVICVAN